MINATSLTTDTVAVINAHKQQNSGNPGAVEHSTAATDTSNDT